MNRNVDTLITAFRSMRKWGFTVGQDRFGQQQSVELQIERAKRVAGDLLGVDPEDQPAAVARLAEAIVAVAQSSEQSGHKGDFTLDDLVMRRTENGDAVFLVGPHSDHVAAAIKDSIARIEDKLGKQVVVTKVK